MKFIKLIFLVSLLFFITPSAVRALEPINAEDYGLPEPASDIRGLIDSLVNWVAVIAGPACMVALIYGGIRYAFAGGNEEKTEQAKKIMKYATIGVAIVIASYALTQLIIELIKGNVPETPSF